MGRDADLVNDGGHLGLQGWSSVPFRLCAALKHQLAQALAHRGEAAGLGHIEIRPLCRRGVHDAALHIAGQDQDRRAVLQLGELIQRLQSVYPCEYDLHHHGVGPLLPHHTDKLMAIPGHPLHGQVRLGGDRFGQRVAEFRACICNQNAFGCFHVLFLLNL